MKELERIVYGIIESIMKSDKYDIEEKLEQVRTAIIILNLEKKWEEKSKILRRNGRRNQNENFA